MWAKALDTMLRQLVQHGRLEVTYTDGTKRRYGNGPGDPVRVRLSGEKTERRLAMHPNLAVGEAYVDGHLTVEGEDIAGLIALALCNDARMTPAWWLTPARHVARWFRVLTQINPAGRSRANVHHHYDLTPELYALFLDADRQYSCAYFRHPDDTLEQAQAQKKAIIARKLCLQPGMHVLDIGCGWGGMALTLARDHGARVLGVTLSEEQLAIATERAAAEGLADRVEFRLIDYRKIEGRFDRIVSVGMFEHVGLPHYRTYFDAVRRLLTDDGVALIHTIGNPGPPAATGPWIRKYIFPGGYIPAMSECLHAIEGADLWTTDVEVWRLHYAETLLHWRRRFEANLDRIRALQDDRFCRMWRYYLAGSEMTFRYGDQCVFQFQLARKRDAVPLTREYLYDSPLLAAERQGKCA
ncbi:cyclopropane-fatty-acyl-phospholipid synthase [Defluviimonas denitrificans]|jgi:cyclopropane-fatty-acyl-phospholipid synthase|uniref:Cyclopropane-fatty-acyl-phospholipid synthase n=1 Tax=Albidovulum denitrificans TaxID=404881 RepID=A0A2S8S6L5_9RHOB|nr:cyclopropane-fatty-acyl-phospholipid synthase family protein [Defluviimonas denitrificans]PQV56432.1 cyclopropane-fatty-acyl-phospholipid synthase [Defluviimonas denitrificans]